VVISPLSPAVAAGGSATASSPPGSAASRLSAGTASPPVSGCGVWVWGRWKRSRAIICCPTTGSLPSSPAALVNSVSVINPVSGSALT
jgi:hypothetical protein